MVKLPELKLNDEAEMRALYERCGISKSTTEAAIKLRRNMPVQQKATRSRGNPVLWEIQRFLESSGRPNGVRFFPTWQPTQERCGRNKQRVMSSFGTKRAISSNVGMSVSRQK